MVQHAPNNLYRMSFNGVAVAVVPAATVDTDFCCLKLSTNNAGPVAMFPTADSCKLKSPVLASDCKTCCKEAPTVPVGPRNWLLFAS